jgi:cytochrome c oxidase assembly protein subunit 11
MDRIRRRNLGVVAFAGAVLAVMGGLVAYSPTLYRIFCDVTGYGGTTQRANATPLAAGAAAERVTISFDANVAPGLDWEFRPEQRSVTTHFGEPVKIYYYAKNNSERTVVARATFNVTPFQVAPYFFKVQCFCFTDEKLAPGESARMPVLLYVDQEMLKDPEAEGLRNITLSYTFFPEKEASAEDVEAARDLKTGSEGQDARLSSASPTEFENDARRR